MLEIMKWISLVNNQFLAEKPNNENNFVAILYSEKLIQFIAFLETGCF